MLDRSKLTFRDMLSEDLSNVLTIERNAHISPWSRLSFEESITKQESSTYKESSTNKESSTDEKSLTSNNKYLCRILAFDEQIVGYFIICPVADEMHILNIVTSLHFQGQGVGHLLMEEIIRLAQEGQRPKIFLEVRASNLVAQNLYIKWQFEQISIRKRYYTLPNSESNEKEDALIFMRYLK